MDKVHMMDKCKQKDFYLRQKVNKCRTLCAHKTEQDIYENEILKNSIETVSVIHSRIVKLHE